MIRAAAVSALAAFANGVPSLTKSILHLLKRCLDDSDDEVRERAFFYIVLIEKDMNETVLEENLMLQNEGEEINELRDFVFDQDTNINVDALEAYLVANQEQLCEQEQEIDIDTTAMMVHGAQKAAVSDIPGSRGAQSAQTTGSSAANSSAGASASQASSASVRLGGGGDSAYFEELKNEEALQPILTSQRHSFSSEAQNLTENDAEYVIKGIKHFFETVVVLQYEIQNTLEDQILSEVQVKISKLESAHGLKLKGMVPLHEEDQIKFNEKRFAYIILSKAAGQNEFPHITISQKLTFKITEIDVDTEEELGNYDEEYDNIQDLVLSTKDYISACAISRSFKESWESLGTQGQREGNLAEKS